MEHTHLKPMTGKSGRESTAITKKTIKELLAEEGVKASDVPLMPASTPEPQAPESSDRRVVDHTRLQPLKGQSRAEPTAFTKKSIKELLAEEGADINDMPMMGVSEPAPAPAAAPTPPAPQPKIEAPAAALRAAFVELEATPTNKSAAKPRSFLGRLIGS